MATVLEAGLQDGSDIELAERMKHGADRIQAELRKLIIGQEQVIEHMFFYDPPRVTLSIPSETLIGPGRIAKLPSGRPGQLCSA